MPWTPESVFENAAEQIESAWQVIGEYHFALKGIPVPITIRLYRVFGTEGVQIHFDQSHFIKTPKQIGPYRTSISFADDAGSALHRAVTTITDHYSDAVKAGEKPEEAWLVPNDDFSRL